MNDKEKAAEEFAKKTEALMWKAQLDKGECHFVSRKAAFLAGYEAAEAKFRPVKIEKDRPETWPPENERGFFLKRINGDWSHHAWFWDADCSLAYCLEKGDFTHWMPIPEIGE